MVCILYSGKCGDRVWWWWLRDFCGEVVSKDPEDRSVGLRAKVKGYSYVMEIASGKDKRKGRARCENSDRIIG